MSLSSTDTTVRYCGRLFSAKEIDWIARLITSEPSRNRAELSRLVCDQLGWLKPNGGRKDMSCRVAMLRMASDGLFTLPPPQRKNTNYRKPLRLTCRADPGFPVCLPADALGELSFCPVTTPRDSSLWNELIGRYHYLGYKPLPGAQIRYLVFSGCDLLAALGFGAAAWKVEPRDRFIGWSSDARQRNLHLVVNNARFLILPWVHSKNLASRILGCIAKRLAGDWLKRYGYQPVLLETFVQQNRFRGTSYRAANWLHVGQTKGRGKLDRYNQCLLPIKDIFLYPLHKRFRDNLCSVL